MNQSNGKYQAIIPNAGVARIVVKHYLQRLMINHRICATIAVISRHGHGFMTNLLILSPRYTPDSINLRRSALVMNWQVDRLQNYRIASNYETANITLYGEALFTTIIAEQLEYTLLEAPADWLGKLPQQYLQRDLQFSTLKESRNINKPTFIKPAEGKSFQAQVYQSSDDLPSADTQADDMPVYVSEPVKWEIEFRCFVLEREIATLSIYSRNGLLAENEDGEWLASEQEFEETKKFIEAILKDENVAMPPAYVLDVGRISGRGWAIVEANPAWASGIYGCDPVAILSVLQRSCIPHSELSEQDASWQINRYIES